jgi:hypothetical protein
MDIKDDSILVFEYFTASGDRDPCIISEAEALILSLIDDLKDFDIFLLIHNSYKYLVKDFKSINIIFIDENLEYWLNNNSKYFKRAIFIAAENNMNLYNLTKILEDNNVKIYNSNSNASLICSDKFKTYEKIKNLVFQPKTAKIKIDSKKMWIDDLKDTFYNWNKSKLIIKPIYGVDCENIKIINDLNDISNDLTKYFTIDSCILVQEFIKGIDISVSLISDGNKAIPISLNKQNIIFDGEKQFYLGGCLPFESKFREKIFEIATITVESIKGIKGFVGVDLILTNNDNVCFLEINSRFTTPYVAIKKIANFNIGENIIDLLDENISISELLNKISFSGKTVFKKEGNNLSLEIYK